MEVEQSEGMRFEKYQGVIEYQCAGKGRSHVWRDVSNMDDASGPHVQFWKFTDMIQVGYGKLTCKPGVTQEEGLFWMCFSFYVNAYCPQVQTGIFKMMKNGRKGEEILKSIFEWAIDLKRGNVPFLNQCFLVKQWNIKTTRLPVKGF